MHALTPKASSTTVQKQQDVKNKHNMNEYKHFRMFYMLLMTLDSG